MSELLLLCAENLRDLKQLVDDLTPRVGHISSAELLQLAGGSPGSNPTGKHRIGIIGKSADRIAENLRTISAKLSQGVDIEKLDDPGNFIFVGRAREKPQLVMLFPGQGAQRLNMGKYAFARFPFVRDIYERVDRALEELMPGGLSPYIFYDPASANDEMMKSRQFQLSTTAVAQPAIVLSSIGALMVLDFLGLKPGISIGHSLGEISAIHSAGAYDGLTAVKIAAFRGKAMQSLQLKDCGGMAVIGANSNEVQKLIEPFGASLIISNYNSPKQTVVSGTSNAIKALFPICQERKFLFGKLPVSHAFHSDIIAPAVGLFGEFLKDMRINGLSRLVISTSTGQEIPAGTDLKELLVGQISRPVRFVEAVLKANQYNPDMWIEVGPGNILSRLVKDILSTNRIVCLATDSRDEDSSLLLNKIISNAYVLGFPLMLNRVFEPRLMGRS